MANFTLPVEKRILQSRKVQTYKRKKCINKLPRDYSFLEKTNYITTKK